MRASGHGVDATRGEVRSAIIKLDSNLVAACNAKMLQGADVDIVLEYFLKGRTVADLPMLMRDKIGNLHGRFSKDDGDSLEQAIETASGAKKSSGKPDFAKYIQKEEKHFGHHVRLEMAQTLAKDYR